MHFFFSPSGRIGRAQWWFGWLLPVTIASSAMIIARELMGADTVSVAPTKEFAAILIVFTSVSACIWINLCLTAKRYHDRNKSSFWYFIVLVPVIGPVWQLVECGFLPGSRSRKDYGRNTGADWFNFGEAAAAPQV